MNTDSENAKVSDKELADMLYAAFSANECDLAYVAKPGQKCTPLQDHEVVRKIFRERQEALRVYRMARGMK